MRIGVSCICKAGNDEDFSKSDGAFAVKYVEDRVEGSVELREAELRVFSLNVDYCRDNAVCIDIRQSY